MDTADPSIYDALSETIVPTKTRLPIHVMSTAPFQVNSELSCSVSCVWTRTLPFLTTFISKHPMPIGFAPELRQDLLLQISLSPKPLRSRYAKFRKKFPGSRLECSCERPSNLSCSAAVGGRLQRTGRSLPSGYVPPGLGARNCLHRLPALLPYFPR